jgi:hypothetical protein
MDSNSGVRVRLDLSEFEKSSAKQFRWSFLSFSEFSTVKDLKNHIRKEMLSGEDPKPKIRLFLEEPFWLPSSESIRILQV